MLVHTIHTVGNGEPLKIGEQGHHRARAASSKDRSHCSTQDGLHGVERQQEPHQEMAPGDVDFR